MQPRSVQQPIDHLVQGRAFGLRVELLVIPWPDWSLPGWLHEILEKAKFVWPVLVAYVAARAEIRRRRKPAQHAPAGRPGDPEATSSATERG